MAEPSVEIVTVDAGNVDRTGFFCYKSKPKELLAGLAPGSAK